MMVFVTVVMACCVNAQSAILRLFLAMRMLRKLTSRPKPLSNCCWKPAKIDDWTDGLNRFACEDEDDRVLFQVAKSVVPVAKPSLNCVLNWEVWVTRLESVDTPVPVPDVSGLLIGNLRSSKKSVDESCGSKEISGLLA